MYNGNDYNTYTSTISPNVQAFSLIHLNQYYNVNQNNEVYGSVIFLNQFEIEPDLLEAIGDSGIFGYVKSSDLDDEVPDSLEEVYSYQAKLTESRVIPLYSNDGVTQVGTFTISYDTYNCIN